MINTYWQKDFFLNGQYVLAKGYLKKNGQYVLEKMISFL